KNLIKKCYEKFKNADPKDQSRRTHDSKCLLQCLLEVKKLRYQTLVKPHSRTKSVLLPPTEYEKYEYS
ncbi:Protein of unknown function, partial [Gryllus bimaculatus]